jgi:hypothetical protein
MMVEISLTHIRHETEGPKSTPGSGINEHVKTGDVNHGGTVQEHQTKTGSK